MLLSPDIRTQQPPPKAIYLAQPCVQKRQNNQYQMRKINRRVSIAGLASLVAGMQHRHLPTPAPT